MEVKWFKDKGLWAYLPGATHNRPTPPGFVWINVKDLPRTVITDGAGCYSWKKTFAWFPVKAIKGKTIWWEKIYRRRVWASYGGLHLEPEREYARLFDILTMSPRDGQD